MHKQECIVNYTVFWIWKIIIHIYYRSVIAAYSSIKSGENDIIVAGGQESMSRTPHATYLRTGIKYGNCNLIDTMLEDGLTDAFHNIHMGITGKTK